MDQAGGVGGLEALGHLDGKLEHFAFGDGAALGDLLFEMATDDEFHGDEKAPEGPPGGEHPHHVGMTERGGEARLFLKGGDAAGVGGIDFVEDFHRHLAVQGVVVGHKHHAHAADGVAPQQRVRAKLALHPGVLAALRALDVGKRPHRRDIHRIPASMTIGDFLRTFRHGAKLSAATVLCKLESCRGRFS